MREVTRVTGWTCCPSAATLAHSCPKCDAKPGDTCRTPSFPARAYPHYERTLVTWPWLRSPAGDLDFDDDELLPPRAKTAGHVGCPEVPTLRLPAGWTRDRWRRSQASDAPLTITSDDGQQLAVLSTIAVRWLASIGRTEGLRYGTRRRKRLGYLGPAWIATLLGHWGAYGIEEIADLVARVLASHEAPMVQLAYDDGALDHPQLIGYCHSLGLWPDVLQRGATTYTWGDAVPRGTSKLMAVAS